MSKLQQKSSPLKREHPALLDMKFLNFLIVPIFVGLFCPPGSGSWRIRIPNANTDPDPIAQN
jgi:hypothetical protein